MKRLTNKIKRVIEGANGSSLRTRFIAIIFLCWVIPVSCLGICGILMYQSYKIQIDSLMLSDLSYAGEFCCERLSTAYDTVCDSTYDKVIESFYTYYLEGKISSRRLTQVVKSSTNTKYSSPEFLMTDIVLNNNSNKHYYLSSLGIKEWYDFYEDDYNTILSVAQELKSDAMFYIDGENIYAVKKLTLQEEYKQLNLKQGDEFGILITLLNKDFVFEHFKNSIFWNNKMVFSVNGISGNVGVYSEKNLDRAVGNARMIKNQDETMIAGESGNKNITFKYATEPSDKRNSELDIFIKMFAVFAVLSFPLLIISAIIFHYKIDKPINELVSATQSLEQGNLGVNINYKGQDEFKYLMESFNHMSGEIKWLFDYTYKEEIALRDAKLMALRSQINPHFLNNTLEMINWKARMSGQEEISKMIESLSIVFDASMSRSNKQLITIEEELKCVNAYMYIILKRFGSRLNVSKEIDTTLMKVNIPPLIVQPVIENAIVHGIETVGSGSLTLRVYRDGEQAVVEVENDGNPLSEDDIKKISDILSGNGNYKSNRQSIGIRNVNERLHLLFGENGKLDIFCTENGKTISKIVLPIEYTAKICNE